MIDKANVREMVDTMVLIYATTKDPSPDMSAQVAASIALLNRLTLVRVSAVAWMEFVRGNSKSDETALTAVQNKIVVEPLDGRVASVAGDLLKRHRATADVCPRCLNHRRKSSACPKCGLHLPQNFRLNDAMIFATAAVLPDVDTLYSYDDGIVTMSKLVAGCEVKEPPNPSGPLFDPRVNPKMSDAQVFEMPASHLAVVGSKDRED